MKKQFLLYPFILLLFFTVFFSCKTTKQEKARDDKKVSLSNVHQQIEENIFHPDWFKAKAQIQYKASGRSISFNSTILSKKNELFWLNGKKFGIEGARILASRDSVFALDRLQKRYLAESIDWLGQEYQLPPIIASAINVENIQDIFIGNPILDIIPYTSILQKDDAYLLHGGKKDYHSNLLVAANNLQAKSASFKQGESEMVIKYSDYRLIDNQHAIAYKRDISIVHPNMEPIQLSLIYSEIVVNKPVDIKFIIPNSYSKM